MTDPIAEALERVEERLAERMIRIDRAARHNAVLISEVDAVRQEIMETAEMSVTVADLRILIDAARRSAPVLDRMVLARIVDRDFGNSQRACADYCGPSDEAALAKADQIIALAGGGDASEGRTYKLIGEFPGYDEASERLREIKFAHRASAVRQIMRELLIPARDELCRAADIVEHMGRPDQAQLMRRRADDIRAALSSEAPPVSPSEASACTPATDEDQNLPETPRHADKEGGRHE